ncbi:MAG TPA: EAL domain-containing protein [Solirubrobacteraceae bacterium]|nr:EAL domain-containing protein [Solirubrobacteraceae bacterium]
MVVKELFGSGRPARMLLVEDDARSAMELGQMLRAVFSRGLVVTHTLDVADATQELADHGATCVLVDVRQTSATVALEQLSAAAPTTPIIVLADADDDQDGVAAVRAGAQDVLPRSELTPAMLGRAVRYAVERKRGEAALAQQALHDPLTSLPNRALFVDRLRGALDRSRRTGTPVAVLFLDVDGFKDINDTLGHGAGDRLLMVLAERFRGMLRPMDTVARFGGDEFTFLFEGLDSEEQARLVAQRITRAAGLPITLAGQQRSVSISIGVSLVTDPEEAIDDVIRQADTAMYRAKESGGDGFEVFEDVMSRLPGPRSHLERELRLAVEREQLRVHYQPRVSFHEGTGLEGFEALVRWEHPELGLMEPIEFMSIAEETGMIVPIGEWVLMEALDQVERWRESRPEVTISVNLSARQLSESDLVQRLSAAIQDGGHDPRVLCLEIAEGALEASPELALRQLAALNELGIMLAIDDYGTGTSSSMTLSELPVHILKIDTTLVSRLGRTDGTEGDLDTVSDAVELGHTLGLKVVAEGVETDAQLAQLRDLGCDGAQGFLFSQPMPEEGVYSLLSIG